MTLDTVLKTMKLIGRDMPAYKALFDQVVVMFSPRDQQVLKRTYDEALAEAEKAHKDAQAS